MFFACILNLLHLILVEQVKTVTLFCYFGSHIRPLFVDQPFCFSGLWRWFHLASV